MFYKKNLIFSFLLLFFLLSIINLFLILNLKYSQHNKDYITTQLNKIKEETQRYSKLKIANKKEKIKEIEVSIENKFNNINMNYKNAIPLSMTDLFERDFFKLYKNWQQLKNTKEIKNILTLSEENLITINNLITYIKNTLKKHNYHIYFLIILISSFFILSLAFLFVIYFMQMKNSQNNLDNFYHLKETLIFLQNRYQRYSKTFAILKIPIENLNNNEIKTILNMLKNNLRKSDKIFYYKNAIIILFIEPEKIDLEYATNRIKALLNKILKEKKPKLILYKGEKLDNII